MLSSENLNPDDLSGVRGLQVPIGRVRNSHAIKSLSAAGHKGTFPVPIALSTYIPHTQKDSAKCHHLSRESVYACLDI